jgi:hypothetical protein
MAHAATAQLTALLGPQHCSFAIHTERAKHWPLFVASSAAIRWPEDRETIIMLANKDTDYRFRLNC